MAKKKTQAGLELTRRVATYSALASAAMLASPAADAALQIWNVNQTISPASFGEQASFNAAFQIFFASSGGGPSNLRDRYFWGPGNNLSFVNNGTSTFTSGGITYSSVGNDPARLPSGVVVGPVIPGSQTGTWLRATSTNNTDNDIQGEWSPGDHGYMGIRFDDNGNYNYGWVDMTMNPDGTVTVNRWALEDTVGASVTTPGAVPEPGTGALLALLAMGATGLRRRRQSAAV
jgi:hypothetical protein